MEAIRLEGAIMRFGAAIGGFAASRREVGATVTLTCNGRTATIFGESGTIAGTSGPT